MNQVDSFGSYMWWNDIDYTEIFDDCVHRNGTLKDDEDPCDLFRLMVWLVLETPDGCGLDFQHTNINRFNLPEIIYLLLDYLTEKRLSLPSRPQPSLAEIEAFFEDRCEFNLTKSASVLRLDSDFEAVAFAYSAFFPLVKNVANSTSVFDFLRLRPLSDYELAEAPSLEKMDLPRMGDLLRSVIEYDVDHRSFRALDGDRRIYCDMRILLKVAMDVFIREMAKALGIEETPVSYV